MWRSPTSHLASYAILCSVVSLAPGCAHEAAPGPQPAQPAPSQAAPATPAAQTSTPAPSAQVKEAAFENPGGMWMPSQLHEHTEQLKKLGLEIDPAALSNPTSFPLGAVISLGGCSASFVSPDGLVITNHHCVTRSLQVNSTPKENLLVNGYLAKTRADEKWNGPTSRVFVTQSFRDVTTEVRDGIEKIANDRDRYRKMEERTKKLVADCEKGRPEVRCTVANYFGGGQQMLIEQIEIRDVRLVYAPHEGVGNFGGEVDNWRWPRHGGDFSFYRAYVGKDGKPADYSPENVPYRPPHHLKLATKPLQAADLVFVAGYPGQTNRLRTAAETQEAVAWRYPRQIAFFNETIRLLEQLSKESPERELKAKPWIRGFSNARTKFQGIVDGLTKGGLAAQKAKEEEGLKAWIDADPARKAAYGDAIAKLAALFEEHKKTREADAMLNEAFSLSRLLSAASAIVRMAEERPKRDADRDPDFQERTWKRLEQEQVALQKSYDRGIDRGLLKLYLQRAARLPAAERSVVPAAIMGKDELSDARIDAALDKLYAGTKLEDEAVRVKLLKTAKTADLQRSDDPVIRLAVALRPAQKDLEAREEAFLGATTVWRPRYIEALRKHTAAPIAPDANGTLRLTYGTVRGYRAEPGAPLHFPFTKVSEMVKKHTGKEPFNAPARILNAANAKKFGPYADAGLGEVPVDFLSDLDITGGNSGSPTLNARGELVGLAFDGNYESMASDWLFMPKITRTIHVDLRYILWVLDAADGADHIVKEMGGAPAVD